MLCPIWNCGSIDPVWSAWCLPGVRLVYTVEARQSSSEFGFNYLLREETEVLRSPAAQDLRELGVESTGHRRTLPEATLNWSAGRHRGHLGLQCFQPRELLAQLFFGCLELTASAE
jgi:hypothetical protein